MNEVATIRQNGNLAPMSEAAALVHMIERAARDPSIDLDKMQKLMEMRERVEAREAEKAFDIAMTDAQAEMRPVAADSSNPQTRSKYASYLAVDRALRPIYTRHGFGLSFNTGDAPAADMVRLLCRVSKGGHSRDYHIDMPADGKGAKGGDVMTKTHATGSAISYGRRYLLLMIFNIAIGEDDDGNAAGTVANSSGIISTEQLQELITGCNVTGRTTDLLAKKFRVESLDMLPAASFDAAIQVLEGVGYKRAK